MDISDCLSIYLSLYFIHFLTLFVQMVDLYLARVCRKPSSDPGYAGSQPGVMKPSIIQVCGMRLKSCCECQFVWISSKVTSQILLKKKTTSLLVSPHVCRMEGFIGEARGRKTVCYCNERQAAPTITITEKRWADSLYQS